MHSYLSPEGVFICFLEKLEKNPTNPDGTFDEKAKAIADAFNN